MEMEQGEMSEPEDGEILDENEESPQISEPEGEYEHRGYAGRNKRSSKRRGLRGSHGRSRADQHHHQQRTKNYKRRRSPGSESRRRERLPESRSRSREDVVMYEGYGTRSKTRGSSRRPLGGSVMQGSRKLKSSKHSNKKTRNYRHHGKSGKLPGKDDDSGDGGDVVVGRNKFDERRSKKKKRKEKMADHSQRGFSSRRGAGSHGRFFNTNFVELKRHEGFGQYLNGPSASFGASIGAPAYHLPPVIPNGIDAQSGLGELQNGETEPVSDDDGSILIVPESEVAASKKSPLIITLDTTDTSDEDDKKIREEGTKASTTDQSQLSTLNCPEAAAAAASSEELNKEVVEPLSISDLQNSATPAAPPPPVNADGFVENTQPIIPIDNADNNEVLPSSSDSTQFEVEGECSTSNDNINNEDDEDIYELELRNQLLADLVEKTVKQESATAAAARLLENSSVLKGTTETADKNSSDSICSPTEDNEDEEEIALREVLLSQLANKKKKLVGTTFSECQTDDRNILTTSVPSLTPDFSAASSSNNQPTSYNFSNSSTSPNIILTGHSTRRNKMSDSGDNQGSPVGRGGRRSKRRGGRHKTGGPPNHQATQEQPQLLRMVRVENEPLRNPPNASNRHPNPRDLPDNDLRNKLLRNRRNEQLQTQEQSQSLSALFPEFGIADTDMRQELGMGVGAPSDMTIRRTVNFEQNSSISADTSSSTARTYMAPINVDIPGDHHAASQLTSPISSILHSESMIQHSIYVQQTSPHCSTPLSHLSPVINQQPFSNTPLMLSPHQFPAPVVSQQQDNDFRQAINPFGLTSQQMNEANNAYIPVPNTLYSVISMQGVPMLYSEPIRPGVTIPVDVDHRVTQQFGANPPNFFHPGVLQSTSELLPTITNLTSALPPTICSLRVGGFQGQMYSADIIPNQTVVPYVANEQEQQLETVTQRDNCVSVVINTVQSTASETTCQQQQPASTVSLRPRQDNERRPSAKATTDLTDVEDNHKTPEKYSSAKEPPKQRRRQSSATASLPTHHETEHKQSTISQQEELSEPTSAKEICPPLVEVSSPNKVPPRTSPLDQSSSNTATASKSSPTTPSSSNTATAAKSSPTTSSPSNASTAPKSSPTTPSSSNTTTAPKSSPTTPCSSNTTTAAKSSPTTPSSSNTTTAAKSSPATPSPSNTAAASKSSQTAPSSSNTASAAKSSPTGPTASTIVQSPKTSPTEQSSSNKAALPKPSQAGPTSSNLVPSPRTSPTEQSSSNKASPPKSSPTAPTPSNTVPPPRTSPTEPTSSNTIPPPKSSPTGPSSSNTVPPPRTSPTGLKVRNSPLLELCAVGPLRESTVDQRRNIVKEGNSPPSNRIVLPKSGQAGKGTPAESLDKLVPNLLSLQSRKTSSSSKSSTQSKRLPKTFTVTAQKRPAPTTPPSVPQKRARQQLTDLLTSNNPLAKDYIPNPTLRLPLIPKPVTSKSSATPPVRKPLGHSKPGIVPIVVPVAEGDTTEDEDDDDDKTTDSDSSPEKNKNNKKGPGPGGSDGSNNFGVQMALTTSNLSNAVGEDFQNYLDLFLKKMRKNVDESEKTVGSKKVLNAEDGKQGTVVAEQLAENQSKATLGDSHASLESASPNSSTPVPKAKNANAKPSVQEKSQTSKTELETLTSPTKLVKPTLPPSTAVAKKRQGSPVTQSLLQAKKKTGNVESVGNQSGSIQPAGSATSVAAGSTPKPSTGTSISFDSNSKALIESLTQRVMETRDQITLSFKEKELLQTRQICYDEYKSILRELQHHTKLTNFDAKLGQDIAELEKKLAAMRKRRENIQLKAIDVNRTIRDKSKGALVHKKACLSLASEVKKLGDKICHNKYKIPDILVDNINELIRNLKTMDAKQNQDLQRERGVTFKQLILEEGTFSAAPSNNQVATSASNFAPTSAAAVQKATASTSKTQSTLQTTVQSRKPETSSSLASIQKSKAAVSPNPTSSKTDGATLQVTKPDRKEENNHNKLKVDSIKSKTHAGTITAVRKILINDEGDNDELEQGKQDGNAKPNLSEEDRLPLLEGDILSATLDVNVSVHRLEGGIEHKGSILEPINSKGVKLDPHKRICPASLSEGVCTKEGCTFQHI